MNTCPEKSEYPLLGRNAYLWTFVPVVVLVSIAVFVICFMVLLFGRAKAGIA
jgi:hypothetical protein